MGEEWKVPSAEWKVKSAMYRVESERLLKKIIGTTLLFYVSHCNLWYNCKLLHKVIPRRHKKVKNILLHKKIVISLTERSVKNNSYDTKITGRK